MQDLDHLHQMRPPEWSLQVGSFGTALVVVSAAFFALAALISAFGWSDKRWTTVASWCFGIASVGVFGTFACLAVLFADNRFEYEYVWSHSDLKNALAYRIAGIWSGQEGSFLLWAVSATIFGLIGLKIAGEYRRWFVFSYALFLGSICGILAYESPFNLNLIDGQPIVPLDGVGLAPSLQNYWVIIHPPTIFLGFGSLTLLFSLALAALITKNYDNWVPIVRPWSMVSLTLVGVGLCMGGFWAYETLGWGGFWMWDPVENVSFVPWCLTAAFVHGMIVQVTKGKWHMGNLLMAAVPFLAFVYGTFLTRSGMLADTSVHSFAEMDRSALKLLLGVMSGAFFGFLILWGIRVRQFRAMKKEIAAQEKPTENLHREGFYKAGNFILIAFGIAALFGMSVPLVMVLMGRQPSVVEEATYHKVLPGLFAPLMILMALAPLVSWRGLSSKEFASKAYSVLCISIGLTGITMLAFSFTSYKSIIEMAPKINMPFGWNFGLAWMLVLVGLCYFALVGNIWQMATLWKRSKIGIAPFLSHVGVGILVAGLIISRGFERKEEAIVMEDHPARVLGYGVLFVGHTSTTNDRDNKVKFNIVPLNDPKNVLFTAQPGFYYAQSMSGQQNPMVWPHIERHPFYDVYFTLHPPQNQVSEEVTLKPGESTKLGEMTITYVEMTREGEMGMAGTRFGAKLLIDDGKKQREVTPKLELAGGGEPNKIAAEIDGTLSVLMHRMNAGEKSVTLQFELAKPMYPIEVYHKPMTSLVWLGTGLMTISGFLAAYYRRVPRRKAATVRRKEEQEPEVGFGLQTTYRR